MLMTIGTMASFHQTLTVDPCVHFNVAAGISIEVHEGSEAKRICGRVRRPNKAVEYYLISL